MNERDLILDASNPLGYNDIADYIKEPARGLWQDINIHIQQNYKASPRITYSKCSAKPGWNVKYQKSGKSLCTLYPELERFIALIVITLDLVPLIEAMSAEFETEIIEIMRSAKPFNGTLWLMIPVADKAMLEGVRELLHLKHETQRSAR